MLLFSFDPFKLNFIIKARLVPFIDCFTGVFEFHRESQRDYITCMLRKLDRKRSIQAKVEIEFCYLLTNGVDRLAWADF